MGIKALVGQRLFTLWFGLGFPPVLAGALAIAFAESWQLGTAASGVLLAWLYHTGQTTCARCAYYGTAKCGLPGLLAARLTERKPAESLSLERIRSHRQLDLWVVAFINGIYALQPWLLPLSLVWSLGVWCIALGPKRHHGLLHRLRQPLPVRGSTFKGIDIAPIGRAHVDGQR
jgi:hypothetical protein